MDEEEIVEMHAIIKGRVQGVFFRATTQEYAERMGITGTVRNVPDGTVEIFAQGPRDKLERFIEKLEGKSGPGMVVVLKNNFTIPTKKFSDFDIIF
jgi:acylphosphatase